MEETFKSYDRGAYQRFTFPQEVDKAVHMLEGIVKGIAIDGVIGPSEIGLLRQWCDDYRLAACRHPYDELVPLLTDSIQDGRLDEEEKKDILWFCSRFTTKNAFFDVATSDMQRLQGLLIGIAADGTVTKEELDSLSSWMQEHGGLRTTWPYDEIDSLVTSILADGKVDAVEHKFLLDFCHEFLGKSINLLLESKIDENSIRNGVCAMCPEILFAERLFCFTGRSAKASRTELASVVARLGGRASPCVNRSVNYLVVGGEGNRAWTFSCYGRKVEEAVCLRKDGVTIQIVHEFDFWDAVEANR